MSRDAPARQRAAAAPAAPPAAATASPGRRRASSGASNDGEELGSPAPKAVREATPAELARAQARAEAAAATAEARARLAADPLMRIADPTRRAMRRGEAAVDVTTTIAHGLYCKLRDGHSLGVYDVSWTDDSRFLASCSHDGSVVVWDVDNCEVKRSYEGHRGPVFSVAFAPSPGSERLLSCSQDGTARLWQKRSGKQLFALRDRGAMPLYAGAWCGDASLVAVAGAARSVTVYNMEMLENLAHHPDTVTADLEVLRIEAAPANALGHSAPVRCLAWSRDDAYLFSGGDDRVVRVWRVAAALADRGAALAAPTPVGGLEFELDEHEGPVLDMAVSPGRGRTLLTASADGTARLWAWRSGGESVLTLQGHGVGQPVYTCCFTPELEGRRCMTGGHDLCVCVWDTETGALLQRMPAVHRSWVLGLAARPDGLAFATASGDRTVGVWRSLPRSFFHDNRERFWTALAGRALEGACRALACASAGAAAAAAAAAAAVANRVPAGSAKDGSDDEDREDGDDGSETREQTAIAAKGMSKSKSNTVGASSVRIEASSSVVSASAKDADASAAKARASSKAAARADRTERRAEKAAATAAKAEEEGGSEDEDEEKPAPAPVVEPPAPTLPTLSQKRKDIGRSLSASARDGALSRARELAAGVERVPSPDVSKRLGKSLASVLPSPALAITSTARRGVGAEAGAGTGVVAETAVGKGTGAGLAAAALAKAAATALAVEKARATLKAAGAARRARESKDKG